MVDSKDKIHYLNTWPTGDDLMGKRPQKAISDAIASHVLDYDNEHHEGGTMPRVIGLEGRWGCGKSNVIRILSNNEKLKEGYHVLEFDAWSYQEDEYRISLMEYVTAQLKTLCQDKGKDIEKLLKTTLMKHESEETMFEPHISGLLLGFLFTIAFTSLFGFVLQKYPDTEYYRWCRAAFVAMPWLAFVVYALFQRKHIDDFWVVFEHTIRNGKTTKNIYTRNPSVADLRQWLDNVSELCDKKLILIIDNMDRLPEEKLKKLWSMIHIFANNEQLDNVWVVIPYDEQKLKQVIGEDYKQYIRKTIPITLRVGEPIISDVRDVFDGLYKKAFGEDEPNLIYIRALFVFSYKRYSIRDIIYFVNSMVTVKRQFPDFSLVSVALYVVMEDEIKENPNEVLLEDRFASKYTPFVPIVENNRNEVAAIVYHVSKDDALQVVYTNVLDHAIMDGDNLPLDNVKDKNDFYKVLTDYCTNVDGELYEGYVDILDEVGANAKDDYRQEIAICWQHVIQFYLGYDPYNLPWVSCEGMKKVLEQCNDEQKRKMMEKFSFDLFSNRKTTGKDIFNYLTELDLIIEKFGADRANVLGTIPLAPSKFKEYLDEAKDQYTKYPVTFEPNEWIEYCTKMIWKNARELLNLRYMRNDERCDFTTLITKAEQLIQEIGGDKRNAFYAYVIYRSLSDKPVNVKPVRSITSSETLNIINQLDDDPVFISLQMYFNDRDTFNENLVPLVSEELLYLMHPLEIFQKCFMRKLKSYEKVANHIVTHKLLCDKRLQSNALEFSMPLVEMGVVTKTDLENYIIACFKDADKRNLPASKTFTIR